RAESGKADRPFGRRLDPQGAGRLSLGRDRGRVGRGRVSGIGGGRRRGFDGGRGAVRVAGLGATGAEGGGGEHREKCLRQAHGRLRVTAEPKLVTAAVSAVTTQVPDTVPVGA